MKNFILILMLLPLYCFAQQVNLPGLESNQATICNNSIVKQDFDYLIKQYLKLDFEIQDTSFNVFTSAKSYDYIVRLDANYEYVFYMVTEKFIDQSSIVLLNMSTSVVNSAFKETGADRHIIAMSYRPVVSGDYTLKFKVIDYAARSTCNRWAVIKRKRAVPTAK